MNELLLNLRKSLNEISVYDLNVYSSIELYYSIANKINEIIKELNQTNIVVSEELINQNNKLNEMLDIGLKKEVVEKINELIANGFFNELINNSVFNELNDSIISLEKDLLKLHNNIKEKRVFIEKPYKQINIVENISSINDSKIVVEVDGKKHDVNMEVFTVDNVLHVDNTDFKDPFIMKDNNKYYMFLSSFCNSIGDISLATSVDLVNWNYEGVILHHENCWGDRIDIATWAPYVTELQSDGYYYMFVCGVDNEDTTNNYRTCILRSRNLDCNWEFIDYLRNNNGDIIKAIDPSIIIEDDIMYLNVSKVVPNSHIALYKSSVSDLAQNRWEYVNTLMTSKSNWENNLIEAFEITKINDNQYIGLYGGSQSHNNQKVGISLSNNIENTFTRIKREGMLFLEVPQNSSCIGHPTMFYNESDKYYYLYCYYKNNKTSHYSIVGYKSKDLNEFTPLKKSRATLSQNDYISINEQLELYTSSMVYEDGCQYGRRIISQVLEDGKVTDSSKFVIKTIIPAKKEITATNTGYLVHHGFLNTRLPIFDMCEPNLYMKLSCTITSDSSTNIEIKLSSGDVLVNHRVEGSSSNKNVTTDWIKVNKSNGNGSNRYLEQIYFVAKCDGGNYKIHDDTTLIFANKI